MLMDLKGLLQIRDSFEYVFKSECIHMLWHQLLPQISSVQFSRSVMSNSATP